MRDKIYSALEYLLAVLFIRGGIVVTFFSEPALGVPSVITLLAGQAAIYIYGAIFFYLGFGILYAKWRKRKNMHKQVLFGMFVISCYITVLAGAINGFGLNLFLPIFAVLLSAFLYIRWKFKTEYINRGTFQKDIEEINQN